MINVLGEIIEQRGMTRYRFWKDSGLAQRTAYRLCDDKEYVPTRDVMEVVCQTLRIQPGEWIKWVPEGK